MESRDHGRGGGETGRRVEQLEKELDVYRRLYRGAVESLKAMRRRQAAAKPAEPAS